MSWVHPLKYPLCAFLGHPTPSRSMEQYAAKLLAEERVAGRVDEDVDFEINCWCGKIWWPIEPDWKSPRED